MANALFRHHWNLDKGKSALSTSSFNPNKETRIYEETAGGYNLTVTGHNSGGEYSWNYSALYDGKPHPVQGRADVDAITAYKISENITVGFFTTNALPGGPYARFVSDDGKTLTVWAGGKNAEGAPYFDVLHYNI